MRRLAVIASAPALASADATTATIAVAPDAPRPDETLEEIDAAGPRSASPDGCRDEAPRLVAEVRRLPGRVAQRGA
jgi:hypothetical protein